MKFLVRRIPRQTLLRFSYLFSHIIALFYKGNNVECPICNSTFSKFLPFGNAGDANRLCPKCLSLERHRLLWLYLKDKTNFFTANFKLLHIAPEQPFIKRFKLLKNLDYTTADLDSPLADIKVDLMDIQFAENTFDIFICNHVLEHVPDDIHAMKEIYRVLKPGGWAILQVPINPEFEVTFEDPSITDPKQREINFGQHDHVRYHGLDFPKRLESAGFQVELNNIYFELSPELRERYRLYKKGEEIVYISRKN